MEENTKARNIKKDIFRYSMIGVALFIMLFFRFILPLFWHVEGGLSSQGMSVLGIFLGTLILWLTVSIDWPSLLCILFLGTVEGLNYKSLFASGFGNDTFVFLLTTFIFTYALSKTNIIKKIANGFVTSKLAQKSPWALAIMFFSAVLICGLFMSPTVLFVVLQPILAEIYAALKIEKGSKYGAMLMMGMAFTVSISSGMTPIGHVFPVLAMNVLSNQTGMTIDYGRYMLFAIPVGLIVFLLMLLVFRFILRPSTSEVNVKEIATVKKEIKLVNRDWIVLSIFALVVLTWVIPSALKDQLPTRINDIIGVSSFASILGVIILSIIKIDGKPLLSIGEACKNGVPFSSLIMCAGTLCVSAALTNDQIGIKSFLTSNLQNNMALSIGGYLFLVIFTLWAVIQTNLSSNMVTATLVTTVSMPILIALGDARLAMIVVSAVGMLSAFAFATPPSMPHIALAGASGYSNTKQVLLYGSIMSLVSELVVISAGFGLGMLIF